MPRGVLQFLINESIDTLPTNANLCRWDKRISAKCSLCKNRETPHHSLNNCEPKLERRTWRHNNVLHFRVLCLTELRKMENLDDSI